MKNIKKISTKNKFQAIIINKNGLEMDKLFSILSKYEEIDVTGIINPVKKSEPNHTLKRVSISKGRSIVIIDPSDIVYLASKDGKVSVVTRTESHLSNNTLNDWEEKLKDYFFFRCHNSYLVNMEKITEVTPFFDNTCFVRFEGIKDKVSVSRSCIKDFRQILGI